MSLVTLLLAVWCIATIGVAPLAGRFLRLAGANDELPAAERRDSAAREAPTA